MDAETPRRGIPGAVRVEPDPRRGEQPLPLDRREGLERAEQRAREHLATALAQRPHQTAPRELVVGAEGAGVGIARGVRRPSQILGEVVARLVTGGADAQAPPLGEGCEGGCRPVGREHDDVVAALGREHAGRVARDEVELVEQSGQRPGPAHDPDEVRLRGQPAERRLGHPPRRVAVSVDQQVDDARANAAQGRLQSALLLQRDAGESHD
ncbi:hypothetical protein QE430_000451 [Microbacterium testaceum]|nr:hypothetical protein [Microbacterium testaceum]MDQ1172144.1 hypothetical protein [Microbacterium testaceum]